MGRVARLVPALVQLRAQVNGRWPDRDKTSDGWVGDMAHSARVSDHNPDSAGWVHAIDVDKDGIDPYALLTTAIKDFRVNYVIYAGVIYSRTYGFRARKYTGANKHDKHLHISVLHGAPAGDGRGWALPGGVPINPGKVQLVANQTGTSPAPAPSVSDVLREGARGDGVLVWQGELWRVGIGVGQHDAVFGPATAEGTRALQYAAGISVDGVVGPATRAAARQVPAYPKQAGPALPLAQVGGDAFTIRQFQARLVGRGWRLDQDGKYGPRTRAVIEGFQRQAGLPADGVGGGQTWVALWTRPVT